MKRRFHSRLRVTDWGSGRHPVPDGGQLLPLLLHREIDAALLFQAPSHAWRRTPPSARGEEREKIPPHGPPDTLPRRRSPASSSSFFSDPPTRLSILAAAVWASRPLLRAAPRQCRLIRHRKEDLRPPPRPLSVPPPRGSRLAKLDQVMRQTSRPVGARRQQFPSPVVRGPFGIRHLRRLSGRAVKMTLQLLRFLHRPQ